jgi:hypothetical protein
MGFHLVGRDGDVEIGSRFEFFFRILHRYFLQPLRIRRFEAAIDVGSIRLNP